MKQGFYVAIDGLSGSGKGTQVLNIASYLLKKDADSSVLLTREPDNSDVGRAIREMRAEHKRQGVDTRLRANDYSEAYIACGTNNSKTIVIPNIEQGIHVVKDRITSITQLAYQRREGVPLDRLCRIWDNVAIRRPDLTLILDIPAETAYEQIKKSGRTLSSLEKPEIMAELRHYFKEIPALLQSPNIKIVNADQPIDKVFDEIKRHIDTRWAEIYK